MLHKGNAIDIIRKLKAEGTKVNCIVTSPPYYNLRDYGTPPQIFGGDPLCQHEWIDFKMIGIHGGDSKKQECHGITNYQDVTDVPVKSCIKCSATQNELGREPHPDIYISHLCDILEEARDLLTDDGSIWINIGDSYAGSGGKGSQYNKDVADYKQQFKVDVPDKSLMGIPARFQLEMINRGFICRNTITWAKNNPFPNPVKDRCPSSTEEIFQFTKVGKVFFYTLQKQYWFNTPMVPTKYPNAKGMKFGGNKAETYGNGTYSGNEYQGQTEKIMRDYWDMNDARVWKFETNRYKGTHTASFPLELPIRCIEIGCPVDGIVLDPFAGTGTTLIAASLLGRKSIGIELSEKYYNECLNNIAPYNMTDVNQP
jgi:DNA modification methylase